jgi:hypothetical protein
LATASIAALIALTPVTFDVYDDVISANSAQAKCCFVGGSNVLMADGSWRPIALVRPGDQVLSGFGRINTVLDVERPKLSGRQLYAFNGGPAFVTAEHPFMTAEGWKSISPAATIAEGSVDLGIGQLAVGDTLHVLQVSQPSNISGLALEPKIQPEALKLAQIEAVPSVIELTVHNLCLDGDHTYVVDGFIVHNKGGDGDGDDGDDADASDDADDTDDNDNDDNDDNDNDDNEKDSDEGAEAFGGDSTPVGPDLTSQEESAAISNGWR